MTDPDLSEFTALAGVHPSLAPHPEQACLAIKGDEVEITGPAIPGNAGKVDDLIRENGLDPAEWIIISTTLNRWDGPVAGGGTQELRQVKVTLRRRPEFIFPLPVTVNASLRLRKRAPVKRDPGRPWLAIVESDHQAPYFDPLLDAAATQMHRDLQPDWQVFAGDLMDLPQISKYVDHPAAQATNQECIDTGHGVLTRRVQAAPNAKRKLMPGNHDWRLESELLRRAERMYGIAPAGETLAATSLRRLLHLDALGIELVEHPLGWEHAEIEIVPGPRGLVVRHGWLTGNNTAGRSLAKRGRSLIVCHTHRREHVFQWDPSVGVERQAVVAGTMSRVRGEAFDERVRAAAGLGGKVDLLFPHFAILDGWTQGLVTVSVWPSGEFLIEHARWIDGGLHWRDRCWRPTTEASCAA